jgi:Tfp pilus assembly protein PilN
MNEPTPSKVRKLSELSREIPPPRDGWPALEAKLREARAPLREGGVEPQGGMAPARRRRPRSTGLAALAAVLAAVVVGLSLDRWMLAPVHPTAVTAGAERSRGASESLPVAYVTDPRYLRERAALLRSLDARLAKLPPPARTKVLQSLATIHQSMQSIRQALGREPGDALLQELLIDTYQDEMQVLSTVQEASGGSGET